MDFDGFVKVAQVLGEFFGTRLENMRKTTLESFLPTIRQMLVDGLSPIIGQRMLFLLKMI